MSRGTVLITGATGFLGSALLIDILRADYSAHIVVRSDQKRALLQQAPKIASLRKSAVCKYFIVPDLSIPGSLDEATRGCNLVIHAASPLPFQGIPAERQHDEFVVPAVACTLSALESAKASGTVTRFVCVSSAGAFLSPQLLNPSFVPKAEVVISEANLNPYVEPPYQDILTAYAAAKTAALRKSIEWMSDRGSKAGFDLINIAPCYIYGEHPLATCTGDLLATSNGMLLRTVLKPEKPSYPMSVAVGVLLDDFRKVVAAVLDERKLQIGKSRGVHTETFLMSQDITWNDVHEIVRREWPEELSDGLLYDSANYPSKPRLRYNSTKLEKTVGAELSPLETMVKSIVPQYLELLRQEKMDMKV